jgi:hypothetical protein
MASFVSIIQSCNTVEGLRLNVVTKFIFESLPDHFFLKIVSFFVETVIHNS